ncbi:MULTISPECIES: hypothetical protein [Dietzia]|uniref:Uncharacterized protein n=3 Tax=Dietzia cinnamea TaxID=321318 RepID=A0AAW5QBU7_9ACTN|nr:MULTISPECIES: hypothetical protein [Dietzia]MCT1641455.1 hypothetical protein [Dietzia cinnamea]MCT2031769.1 hypothetical protein [Dietzia cinnamea]MCT2035238.1 hypothetical protein [Dietzia cinnamea]MCT2061676.1 hypothetical protein [Dietzia cinnamea]MCT2077883.1 hypothetical protein [Dietzia cinnamea]
MTQDKAGTMQFGPEAAGMIPNETVYAAVGLREQHNKMDAKVTLTKVTSDTGPLGKWITLGVSAPLTENPSDCSTVPVAKTTLLESADAQMATFDLAGGQTRWFCFSATLDPKTPANTAPTASKNIQWKFDAESKEKVAPAAEQTAE